MNIAKIAVLTGALMLAATSAVSADPDSYRHPYHHHACYGGGYIGRSVGYHRPTHYRHYGYSHPYRHHACYGGGYIGRSVGYHHSQHYRHYGYSHPYRHHACYGSGYIGRSVGYHHPRHYRHYGYGYPYGSGYELAALATAPVVFATAATAPLVTGRSVAASGNYCATPVKTCLLYEQGWVGTGCSCKVYDGEARGTVE
jgi:hypothetical protein